MKPWRRSPLEKAGGTANGIVLRHSADGTTWSPVRRIPLNPVGSNVDHFTPAPPIEPQPDWAE